MLTMPPPKKKPTPAPEKPDRRGVFLRLGPARDAALDAFAAAQTVPPKRATVILQALDEFLARHGFPPRSKS
jgi:hypothetical protein